MAVVIPFDRAAARRPPSVRVPLAPAANPPVPRHRPLSFGRLATAIANYARRRAAIRSLRSLDERLLRDIGIGRADIATTVDLLLAGRTATRGCVIAACSKTPADR